MPTIPSIHTWSDGDVVYAADLNGNCSTIRTYTNTYCAFLDGNQTFTGTNTFSAAVTTSAGVTVNTTGLTIAPQTAVTFTHASARIIPGATGLYFRDTANAADNIAITDAGAVTVRAGLVIGGAMSGVTSLTMSGALIGATALSASAQSALTFSHATARIIPGATSLHFRNTADGADTLSITNAGVVTIASHLNVSGAIGGNGASAVSISGTTCAMTGSSGLIRVGSLGVATTATDSITQISTCAGIPSGAVADGALIVDTTNNRLYVRSTAAWRYATLT